MECLIPRGSNPKHIESKWKLGVFWGNNTSWKIRSLKDPERCLIYFMLDSIYPYNIIIINNLSLKFFECVFSRTSHRICFHQRIDQSSIPQISAGPYWSLWKKHVLSLFISTVIKIIEDTIWCSWCSAKTREKDLYGSTKMVFFAQCVSDLGWESPFTNVTLMCFDIETTKGSPLFSQIVLVTCVIVCISLY